MFKEDDQYYIHVGPEPSEPIPNTTLGREIYDSLITNNETRPALVDAETGQKLSFQQLLQDSCNIAASLAMRGYKNGSMVAISSENNLQFFPVVFGAFFNGSVVVPINHNYISTELRHVLNITKPRIVFCARNLSNRFIQVQKELGFIQRIVIIDSEDAPNGTESLGNFVRSALKGTEVLPARYAPFDEDPAKNPAAIMCSSGTTGMPKGVMLSHTNIMVRVAHSRDPRFCLGTASNSVLGLMPFFHAFGFINGICDVITGKTTISMRKFDEDLMLRTIQDYKIDFIAVAPPLAIFLAKTNKLKNYDLSSVRQMVFGAAPLSKETEEELKRRFKMESIRQAYGLTEATQAVTISSNFDKVKYGSSGKVMPFVTLKIMDPESGKSMRPNQVGEVCIKGPCIMLGYYGNEKATRESFTPNGWLRTGDLAYIDDEGYIFIVDRLKELIKYKGYQVAPAELEAILVNHPKVRDAAVLGLPDELAGELPTAFVVMKDGESATEDELHKYVNAQVSPQKRLRGGIIFVDSIPKNPSGKILRRELRLRLKDYINKPKSKL